jgi:hypothetical protein
MKGKGNQGLQWRNAKRKEGWEETNSRQVIYLVVSVCTKPPLVQRIEELHTRVLLSSHQVSHKSTTWLVTKIQPQRHLPSLLITFMLSPLRSFSTKGGSLHVHPHKDSSPHHTKSDGRRCCWRATKAPRLRRTLYILMSHPEISNFRMWIERIIK